MINKNTHLDSRDVFVILLYDSRSREKFREYGDRQEKKIRNTHGKSFHIFSLCCILLLGGQRQCIIFRWAADDVLILMEFHVPMDRTTHNFAT